MVWIHLADTSSERGQFNLLFRERYRSSLLLYAYRHKAGSEFATKYWEPMYLHLAGIAAYGPNEVYRGVDRRLDSYAYRDEAETYMRAREAMSQPSTGQAQTASLTERRARPERSAAGTDPRARRKTPAHPPSERRVHRPPPAQPQPPEAEDPMHLHMAGKAAPGARFPIRELIYPEIEKRLDSFADPEEAERARISKAGCRVLIDSGAFTAFTQGKQIRPQDYAAWAIDFRKRWGRKLSWLRFFNLDVIGDQDASWQNQTILEHLGLDVIPVVTHGADIKHVERALADYEYFALGGLVPLARKKTELQAWLDHVFRPVVKKFKQTGVMPKVHLLGVSQQFVLERYPAYSCDSSSWVTVLRFGHTDAIRKEGKVPHAKKHPEINIFALRQEIRRFKDMEEKMTALWTRRGVRFED